MTEITSLKVVTLDNQRKWTLNLWLSGFHCYYYSLLSLLLLVDVFIQTCNEFK